MIDLLAAEPVSDEYVKLLRLDLEEAVLIRFAVCYVSPTGLDAIGSKRLRRALKHPSSLGVASLTCSCGGDALVDLARDGEFGEKLRYFLGAYDYRPGRRQEPTAPILMHSKMVYICRSDGVSVTYVGSHNWTGRALGVRGLPRNAEASVRVVEAFSEDHLIGVGTSTAARANRHIMDCFNSPLALSAGAEHEGVFREWTVANCPRAPKDPVSVVVLTVCDIAKQAEEPRLWADLVGQGIYLQMLDEEAGTVLWEKTASNKVLLMAWPDTTGLRRGTEPVMLRGRISTRNPRANSNIQGSNTARQPIDGFYGHAYSEKQRAQIVLALPPFRDGRERRAGAAPKVELPRVRLRSGREVFYLNLNLHPGESTTSASVDGELIPTYQFLFEVEEVYLPQRLVRSMRGELPSGCGVYSGDLFAVHSSRRSRAEAPRYSLPPTVARRGREELHDRFGVDLDNAKGVPAEPEEEYRRQAHPLHATYAGEARGGPRPEALAIARRDNRPVAVFEEERRGEEGESPEPLPAALDVRHAPFSTLRAAWRALLEGLDLEVGEFSE